MKTKPATGITRLLKMVDLNVFTNSVTFIAYVLFKLFGILDVFRAQKTGWLFTFMSMALVVASKASNVLMIWAFKKWLRSSRSTALLDPVPMAAPLDPFGQASPQPLAQATLSPALALAAPSAPPVPG